MPASKKRKKNGKTVVSPHARRMAPINRMAATMNLLNEIEAGLIREQVSLDDITSEDQTEKEIDNAE